MESEKELKIRGEICQLLMRIGALRFGVFILTSGKKSPYYVDLRVVPSFPDAFKKVCDLYIRFIERTLGIDSFDRVAGVPTGGMPFASLIAYRLEKPFFYVRPSVRLHGRERKVEGIIASGDRVLLIDDLVTTGGSIKKAAAAIRGEGGIVSDAVVLLDREEGGREELAKEGVILHFLLSMSEVANELYGVGAITRDQLKTILNQAKITK